MNIFKLITKNGRQSVARELLKEYLTPEVVANYAAKGVNNLLGRIQDKEKLGTVAVNVAQGSEILTLVSNAIKDGEVTGDEAAEIVGRTRTLLGTAVTDDHINALIDKAVSYVP